MNNKTDSIQKQKKAKGDDLVFPIIALCFAIYYISTIIDLSWEAQINGFLIGTALIALVILFLIKTGIEVKRGEASLKFETFGASSRVQWSRFGILLLTIAYAFVIEWAGFTLTTFGFLITGMIVLGVKSRVKLIGIALILSLTGYVFFITLLDTRFPPGPFERLVESILN